jgi:hypothetical protein
LLNPVVSDAARDCILGFIELMVFTDSDEIRLGGAVRGDKGYPHGALAPQERPDGFGHAVKIVLGTTGFRAGSLRLLQVHENGYRPLLLANSPLARLGQAESRI